VEEFRDWGLASEATLSRYIEETELAWLFGTVPPEHA